MSILIGICIFISGMALFIGIDLFIAYHLHRCPYCGHRMLHVYTKENEKGFFHVFHCSKCGAWDEVPEDTLIGVNNDTEREGNNQGV